MSFKRAKVVMLPTNEKAPIYLYGGNSKINTSIGIVKLGYLDTYQHLYITSDDKIKDGDWYIYNNELLRQFNEKSNPSAKLIKRNKKIIATTDKLPSEPFQGFEMETGKDLTNYLPEPSQAFIQKYIEEYNKGNVITDVLVEYEDLYYKVDSITRNSTYGAFGKIKTEFIHLKINPKDNTITIKKVKDSWSREEVEKLIFEYGLSIGSNIECYFKEGGTFMISKQDTLNWIEENL